jgi:uncharacterized protein YkwD
MTEPSGTFFRVSMTRRPLSALAPWAALSLALFAAAPALASTAPAPVDPAGRRGCLPDGGGDRHALVTWMNGLREKAGLDPLLVDPHLCVVAQRRAEEMAAAGSVESSSRTIPVVSRALLAAGYEAHRWTERAILGYDPPVRMAERWGAGGEEAFHDTVLGPFEEVGVGIAPDARDGGTVLSLLFAVPRLSELTRVSEPLADLDEVRAKALARVNEARRAAGRPPVVPNPRLDAAAQRYAEVMLHDGFYGHVTRRGGSPRSRAEAAGYRPFSFLGENIAQGLFGPEEVVERWLASPGHRRNILEKRASDTGLGVAFGDTPDGFRVLWVQLFGHLR